MVYLGRRNENPNGAKTMTKVEARLLEAQMLHEWDNPPPPFNPDFCPKATNRSTEATRLIDLEEAQSGRVWTLGERKRRRDEIYEALR